MVHVPGMVTHGGLNPGEGQINSKNAVHSRIRAEESGGREELPLPGACRDAGETPRQRKFEPLFPVASVVLHDSDQKSTQSRHFRSFSITGS